MTAPALAGRIYICDDEEGRAADWVKQVRELPGVQEHYQVEAIQRNQFLEDLPVLEKRRQAASAAGDIHGALEEAWTTTVFDESSILVLDYDLFGFDPGHYVTGEDVGYLARCFSRCGLVVALNQFKEGFDLTLRGHPDSWADVNVTGTFITNTGLWQEPWSGFRPWYWPLLPMAERDAAKRAEDVLSNPDAPVLEFLGLKGAVSRIAPKALDFLSGASIEPEAVTFRHFLERSGNGLRARDVPAGPKSAARIAAARLTKWLECWIVPEQDVLVDAPHLALRYPALLREGHETLAAWNSTATLTGDPVAGLHAEAFAGHRFPRPHWLSRPMWLGDDMADAGVLDPYEPGLTEPVPPYVFCEDVSRFAPRSGARTFVADVSSRHVERHVLEPEQAGEALGSELRRVDYRPAFRLAM